MCDLMIVKGNPYPNGLTTLPDGINMAVPVKRGRSLVLCLYDRSDGHRAHRISIPDDYRVGDVYGFVIKGIDLSHYTYSFYDGQKMFCDPYSVAMDGCDKWGVRRERSQFPPVPGMSNAATAGMDNAGAVAGTGTVTEKTGNATATAGGTDTAYAGNDTATVKDAKKAATTAGTDAAAVTAAGKDATMAAGTDHVDSTDTACGGYDWEDDKKPNIPLGDVIMYTLHVRGFTRHPSSGVKYPGCFEGIIEKIPYLKELGINQIELMPAYDFDEIIHRQEPVRMGSRLPAGSEEAKNLEESLKLEEKKRSRIGINYWGYTQDAYYFAPKAAYSGIHNAPVSMKNLVKALHKAGIEVVMQMYFPDGTLPGLISDCIRFWVLEYHIDGVNLMGSGLPKGHILSDPIFADTKIYMRELDDIPEGHRRNTALIQDGFMYDMRRFLKSDEDMLRSFVRHQLDNPQIHGVINYITNYYGFTLMDLVSYDRKHNEDNGEDNRDGTDYNFSWNCGMEGKSRRKYVRSLRVRQIFNALSFLFLSAGIPKLMAGDEFGNSQAGNNNAYCQDNRVTWLDWDDLKRNREIFDYVRSFIAFRRGSDVLRKERPLSLTDTHGVGLPEVSYHGELAWFPHYESYSRTIGCMYAMGDEYIYTAYNMYWIEERFALPKLPRGAKWYMVMKTTDGFVYEKVPLEDQENILVGGRTVVLLMGKPADRE